MQAKVITPPDTIGQLDAPVVFLAGPILGAPNWHEEAIRLLGQCDQKIYVASPKSALNGKAATEVFLFNDQVDWETYHLRLAGTNGIILFWLPAEQSPQPGRAYAQTSRFELAEWKMRHERDGARVVVGLEDDFFGGRYIRLRLAADAPLIPQCDSLEQTCQKVLDIVREQFPPRPAARK